jgi:hypothetical protein
MFNGRLGILATASLGLFGVNYTESPGAYTAIGQRRPKPKRQSNKRPFPNEPTGRVNKQYRLKGIRP